MFSNLLEGNNGVLLFSSFVLRKCVLKIIVDLRGETWLNLVPDNLLLPSLHASQSFTLMKKKIPVLDGKLAVSIFVFGPHSKCEREIHVMIKTSHLCKL